MSSQEQKLIEDLVTESISIYGHDVFYCPRILIAKDDIYGEDNVSLYDSAYMIDMYIRSFDSYEGDGQFLSKFNLEIRDQMRFVVSIRRFADEVAADAMIDRPQEGDLIYSPMLKRIFVIMFVNDKHVFYQLGGLQSYELTCEVFEYSNERLETGIPEIDALEDKFSTALESFGINVDGGTLVDESGQPITQSDFDFDKQNQDVFADNDELQDENTSNNVVDWSGSDPFSEDC